MKALLDGTNFVQVIVQPYGITCSYNAVLGKLKVIQGCQFFARVFCFFKRVLQMNFYL